MTVTAAAATTLILTGSADLILAGVSGAALKSIDGSAATGGLTLGDLNAGTATVKTGAGNDSFAIQATKVTVDAGAGNDTVTLKSAIAVGSSINLGAGNDVLLSSGGSVAANDTTASTVIDAGAGIDAVAASLINATNAKQFVNFEAIDASVGNTNLDIALMTGSTIAGLTLNGGNGTVTVQNLAAGAGLTVAGDNTGSLTIGVKGATANTADTFALTFAGKAGATATATSLDTVSATKIALTDVEAVTVASSGTGFVKNTLDLGANAALKTLTITGDHALDLTFSGVNGVATPTATTGVSSIDGSAATGALNITLHANVHAITGGVTVKGGSAADTITTDLATTTLTGGAGKDVFIVEKTVATTTVAATTAFTTITDFTAGDKVDLTADTITAATLTKIALTGAVQNLDQALDLVGAAAATVSWFNYGADTYVVYNKAVTAGLTVGDTLVKLTGLIDLTNATVGTDGVFTLA